MPSAADHCLPVRLIDAVDRLPSVIRSIGGKHFARELLQLLVVACDAQHCTLFGITEEAPFPVMAVSRDGTDTAERQFSLYLSGLFWREDVFMADTLRTIGTRGFSIGHINTSNMRGRQFRDRLYRSTSVGEKILLCGRGSDCIMGLSILRSDQQGNASTEELSCLEFLSGTLLSIMDRHVSALSRAFDASMALMSLATIEATLQASDIRFSRREVEVASRILYGITTPGIALDLAISVETVVTYRKRAYQRLAIACQRELLTWYLHQWSVSIRDAAYPSTERCTPSVPCVRVRH